MRVAYHPNALSRLEEIEDYWSEVAGAARAQQITDELVRIAGLLADNPLMFEGFYLRSTPPPPRHFRRGGLKPYAIVYVVVPERHTVLVVDYWHNARDPDALRDSLDQIAV